jgi:hypothetical protein
MRPSQVIGISSGSSISQAKEKHEMSEKLFKIIYLLNIQT